ncbi:leucine-rich repeats and immunoglobulin-like domains protein 3 [Tribolium madens]|uniref:leucine-rich repeats and immunoglobulin-like domains protein 3 n=1 Tax=Tribolium madens TaxID=41895 RepID=UPI001CF738E9|nr:leucine-rich repeats and immunoglobulin-like domains protein 3 [Tribolium madens]
MTSYTFLSLCFLTTYYSFVLCDYYKNDSPLLNSPFNNEQIKNQLDHIHITYENIPTITREIFKKLSLVKKLEIEFCNVKSVEKNSFWGLENLRKLSLKHNLLTEIQNNTFSGTNIEELDLSDNQIERIESTAFGHMHNLRSLKLKNNRIQTYQNTWFKLTPNLCSLNLQNNFITSLPARILDRRGIWSCSIDLILSYNRIEEVDEEAFSNYKFNKLYLDHNNINVLPSKVFSNSIQIMDLKLNNNRIVCTLPEMKTVQRYDVSANLWDEKCLLEFEDKKVTTSTQEASTTERVFRYPPGRDIFPPPFHSSMGRFRYRSRPPYYMRF